MQHLPSEAIKQSCLGILQVCLFVNESMGDLITVLGMGIVGASYARADVSNSRLMSLTGSSFLMLRWWQFLQICLDRIDTKYDLSLPADDITFPAIWCPSLFTHTLVPAGSTDKSLTLCLTSYWDFCLSLHSLYHHSYQHAIFSFSCILIFYIVLSYATSLMLQSSTPAPQYLHEMIPSRITPTIAKSVKHHSLKHVSLHAL